MNKEVLVSICCITYNHQDYIRACLDGFVMQKTNFSFEIIIHDDSSTDGTADIIREYEAKYPDLFKPIYQTENQYSHNPDILPRFVFPRATGKYIAICEGDDYWTDPLKLQKQVEFMEVNIEYSMCFHNAKVINMSNLELKYSNFNSEKLKKVKYNTLDIILIPWFVPTASILFRNNLGSITESSNDIDIILSASLEGFLFYDKDVKSIYRYHSSPHSSSSSSNAVSLWKRKMLFLRRVDAKTKYKYLFFTSYIRMKVSVGFIYRKLCGKQ